LGARTGRDKGPKPVPLVSCKNCGSSNPVTSEFCGKCGIKARCLNVIISTQILKWNLC
jgi:hypothetical protein